jgi:hypothetical protein
LAAAVHAAAEPRLHLAQLLLVAGQSGHLAQAVAAQAETAIRVDLGLARLAVLHILLRMRLEEAVAVRTQAAGTAVFIVVGQSVATPIILQSAALAVTGSLGVGMAHIMAAAVAAAQAPTRKTHAMLPVAAAVLAAAAAALIGCMRLVLAELIRVVAAAEKAAKEAR